MDETTADMEITNSQPTALPAETAVPAEAQPKKARKPRAKKAAKPAAKAAPQALKPARGRAKKAASTDGKDAPKKRGRKPKAEAMPKKGRPGRKPKLQQAAPPQPKPKRRAKRAAAANSSTSGFLAPRRGRPVRATPTNFVVLAEALFKSQGVLAPVGFQKALIDMMRAVDVRARLQEHQQLRTLPISQLKGRFDEVEQQAKLYKL